MARLLDFSGQNLQGRCFKELDLSGANFSHSDLRGADFTNANLTGANFSYATTGLKYYWAAIFLLLSGIPGIRFM